VKPAAASLAPLSTFRPSIRMRRRIAMAALAQSMSTNSGHSVTSTAMIGIAERIRGSRDDLEPGTNEAERSRAVGIGS
jgi:hypothetical protein